MCGVIYLPCLTPFKVEYFHLHELKKLKREEVATNVYLYTSTAVCTCIWFIFILLILALICMFVCPCSCLGRGWQSLSREPLTYSRSHFSLSRWSKQFFFSGMCMIKPCSNGHHALSPIAMSCLQTLVRFFSVRLCPDCWLKWQVKTFNFKHFLFGNYSCNKELR